MARHSYANSIRRLLIYSGALQKKKKKKRKAGVCKSCVMLMWHVSSGF